MDLGNLPTIFGAAAAGGIALYSAYKAFLVSTGFGKARILEDRFTGKRSDVIMGPSLSLKSPRKRSASFPQEVQRDGSLVVSGETNEIDLLETTYKLDITNIPTADGNDVSFSIGLPLQILDPKRFVSVSNNPLTTTLAAIEAEITPVLKEYTLDQLRGDRTVIEKRIKEIVEGTYVESDDNIKANKYGVALNGVIISDPQLSDGLKRAMERASEGEWNAKAAAVEGSSMGRLVLGTAVAMAGKTVNAKPHDTPEQIDADALVDEAVAKIETIFSQEDIDAAEPYMQAAASLVQTKLAADAANATVIVAPAGESIPPATLRAVKASASAPATP